MKILKRAGKMTIFDILGIEMRRFMKGRDFTTGGCPNEALRLVRPNVMNAAKVNSKNGTSSVKKKKDTGQKYIKSVLERGMLSDTALK